MLMQENLDTAQQKLAFFPNNGACWTSVWIFYSGNCASCFDLNKQYMLFILCYDIKFILLHPYIFTDNIITGFFKITYAVCFTLSSKFNGIQKITAFFIKITETKEKIRVDRLKKYRPIIKL